MAETIFYIVGGVVVVLAVLVSIAGLRAMDRFPSSRRSALGIGVLFAALVIGTGAFAWIQAAEHHDEYAAQHAAEREEQAGIRAAQFRDAAQPTLEAEESEDIGGEQVFDSAGCASCHTLEAAGSSSAVGPSLDEVLPGQSAEEIELAIVDPEARVTPGFPPGLMPDTYEDTLTPEELSALVEFLVSSAGS